MIKYKGQTSIILKDLSLALNLPVQLKASEEILCLFFNYVLNNISKEKSITLISQLPPSLKVFCMRKKSSNFSPEKNLKTTSAILKVLDQHIQAEHLIQIYSCFPDPIFPQTKVSKTSYQSL